MPQLTLTPVALSSLAAAQQSGHQLKIHDFALTNAESPDLPSVGSILYRGAVSEIAKENDHTIRVKCLMPSGLAINDVVHKCYLYDEHGGVFAYGNINAFKYTQSANLEAEINVYLSYSNTGTLSLSVPSTSLVDRHSFDTHKHDDRYTLKKDIDTFGRRYVTTIDLRGMPFDTMYPVPFQATSYIPVVNIEIHRGFTWDNDQSLDGENSDHGVAVAGVNIGFSLSDYAWGGNRLPLKIKYNSQTYRETVSNINYRILAKVEKKDPHGINTSRNMPTTEINGVGMNQGLTHSGFYLRGGLRYQIICDQPITFEAVKGSLVLYEKEDPIVNVKWTAVPIPVDEASFGDTNYDLR